MTAEQVRAARAEGYAAGHARQPSRPNPYAPEHMPVWRDRRTAAEKAAAKQAARPARILAWVWLNGHRAGLAAYATERGLTLSPQTDSAHNDSAQNDSAQNDSV